jgi:hypothetical protein
LCFCIITYTLCDSRSINKCCFESLNLPCNRSTFPFSLSHRSLTPRLIFDKSDDPLKHDKMAFSRSSRWHFVRLRIFSASARGVGGLAMLEVRYSSVTAELHASRIILKSEISLIKALRRPDASRSEACKAFSSLATVAAVPMTAIKLAVSDRGSIGEYFGRFTGVTGDEARFWTS